VNGDESIRITRSSISAAAIFQKKSAAALVCCKLHHLWPYKKEKQKKRNGGKLPEYFTSWAEITAQWSSPSLFTLLNLLALILMAAAAAAASAPRLLLPPAASTFPHQHEHVRRNWHRPRRQVISARAGASVAARGLDADDFRHPLDKQNTLLLRAVPGLNDMGKALLGPVSEQVMVLQNIGSSVLVSENQLSDLHQILTEAAKLLNTDAPDLYIRQNPVPNAYTLAISGKKPFIVVHTSLVELLTRKELQVDTWLWSSVAVCLFIS
jgi:Zn-dependent protease with chaperone function